LQETRDALPNNRQTRGHEEPLVQLVFFSMVAAGTAIIVAAWASSAVWTARDAQRRCGHVALRVGAPLAAIVLPFAGAALYALVRPCEERAHVKERRMRQRLFEATLVARDDERCGECATPLRPEFRCCPTCGDSLRTACVGCGRLVGTSWSACPWCTTSLVERDQVAALSDVA